jgi:anti-sigma factor RsiW
MKMRDEDLGKLLRELPRESAREGFTERAISKARGEARRTARVHPWRYAAAAVLALLMLSAAGLRLGVERRSETARTESLRAQHEELKLELGQLRASAGFDPIIDLGRNDGVQYILDLRDAGAGPARSASYSQFD